jgi:hypothetical protein
MKTVSLQYFHSYHRRPTDYALHSLLFVFIVRLERIAELVDKSYRKKKHDAREQHAQHSGNFATALYINRHAT